MTFWDTATREQKLSQIDGGIECGMSPKHIAMCLGAPSQEAVKVYGNRSGRSFHNAANRTKSSREAGRVSGVISSRQRGTPDYEIHSAFSIFDTDDQDETFLEEVA